jgi:tricorn protease interacting factor F2/3
LRPFAIGAMGKLGDGQTIKEANRRFGEFLKKPGSLKPDIASAVFSLVAWDGDGKTYDRMLSLYRNAKTQEEAIRFLDALSSFSDPKFLGKTLDLCLTDDVRSQDIIIPIAIIAGNPRGKDIVWPWVKANWKAIEKKIGFGSPLMRRVIASLSCVDAPKEGEIRKFFRSNPAPGTEMILEQTMERVRIRTGFLERMRKDFKA